VEKEKMKQFFGHEGKAETVSNIDFAVIINLAANCFLKIMMEKLCFR